VVGASLFGLRAPVAGFEFLNLPAVVTLVELTAAVLVISGFGIFTSWLSWPGTLADELMVEVFRGNLAAGLVLMGLKVFNGLALIGFSVVLAMGGGLGPASQ
jgi:hypothetical protein